jgi:hypothetical protein
MGKEGQMDSPKPIAKAKGQQKVTGRADALRINGNDQRMRIRTLRRLQTMRTIQSLLSRRPMSVGAQRGMLTTHRMAIRLPRNITWTRCRFRIAQDLSGLKIHPDLSSIYQMGRSALLLIPGIIATSKSTGRADKGSLVVLTSSKRNIKLRTCRICRGETILPRKTAGGSRRHRGPSGA